MSDKKPLTQWHEWLGEMLRLALAPLDVEVHTEINVLSKSPRADILLIRRHTAKWTDEQLQFVPSGIRNSDAPRILIEFKMTASLSKEAVIMLVAYHLLYSKNNRLDPATVLPVLIVSKQPRRDRLQLFGFEPTDEVGVYRNANIYADNIMLLVLNELETTLYNAFIQFFASREKIRERAMNRLQKTGLDATTPELYWFAAGVWTHQSNLGEPSMQAMTTEQVIEHGREWAKLLVRTLPPEDRLVGLEPEEIRMLFEQYFGKKIVADDGELEINDQNSL